MFCVSTADPSADPASAEERISQEASELEKRLSVLSHCSLASSTGTWMCKPHLWLHRSVYEQAAHELSVMDLSEGCASSQGLRHFAINHEFLTHHYARLYAGPGGHSVHVKVFMMTFGASFCHLFSIM